MFSKGLLFLTITLSILTASCARDNKLNERGNKNKDPNGPAVVNPNSNFEKVTLKNVGDMPSGCQEKKPEDFIWALTKNIPTITTAKTSITYKPASKSCYVVGNEYPVKNKKADTPTGENVIVKKIVLVDVLKVSSAVLKNMGFTTNEELKNELDISNGKLNVDKDTNIIALIYVSPKSINVLDINESETDITKPTQTDPSKPIEVKINLPQILTQKDIDKRLGLCQKDPADATKFKENTYIHALLKDHPTIFSKSSTAIMAAGLDSCYFIGQKLPLQDGKKIETKSNDLVVVEKMTMDTLDNIAEEHITAMGFASRDALKERFKKVFTNLPQHKDVVAVIYIKPESLKPLELPLPEVLSVEDNSHITKTFTACNGKSKNYLKTMGLEVANKLKTGVSKLNIFPGKNTNCVRVGTFVDDKNKCAANTDCSRVFYIEKIVMKKAIDLTDDEAKEAGFENLILLKTKFDEVKQTLWDLEVEDDFEIVNLVYVKVKS